MKFSQEINALSNQYQLHKFIYSVISTNLQTSNAGTVCCQLMQSNWHVLNKRDIIDVLALIFLGWWLSMEPKNHIYRKISNNTVANQLTSKSDARHLVELCDPRLRFATRNDKTLGFKQV